MKKEISFTEGKIVGPLLRFSLPVLFAMFLQAMYGAVDLLVVGQFSDAPNVSGVATGSQILFTINSLITSFSMGLTILLGHQIGMGHREKGGRIIGNGILLFGCIGIAFTVFFIFGAGLLSTIMHAPAEAYEITRRYVRICGTGSLIIITYNLIGSIFRGLGDSKTPLISVGIACVFNIAGDLLLVAVFHLGAAGAAIATVMAQGISVVISFFIIRRQTLPFQFRLSDIRFEKEIVGRIFQLGIPIATQDFLVGISFLIIQAIVNSLGVIPSAGVGVAEKACAFIMLVPLAFMQSMSAFVAQNAGAGKYDRAMKTLFYGVLISLCFGVLMFFLAFFHGDALCSIFSGDPDVIQAGFQYLKAYGIDCMLTAFLFCFVGFYNGLGLTKFVMLQGIAGAFGVRVPVSLLMSKIKPVSLFYIGLATPASSILQIILCGICMLYVRKKIIRKAH